MRWPDKLFIVAAAEAAMAIRSKAFIIGMMFVPVMSAASIGLQRISQRQIDSVPRRFAVVDETRTLYEPLAQIAADYNASLTAGRAQPSGAQMLPEQVQAGGRSMDDVRRELVARVRAKQLKAFVEIPADAVLGGAGARVRYYSPEASDTALPRWIESAVSRAALNERFRTSGVDRGEIMRLTRQLPLVRLDLPSIDARGVVQEAVAIDVVRTFAAPMITMMLLLFVVLSSAPALLNSVLEEKLSRTNEVMLGSVSPFQFMGGKLVGSVAVSLVVAAVYMTAVYFAARTWGYADMVTPRMLVWFVVYGLIGVFLFGAVFISIGAACNDIKDSQTMMMPAMLVVMLPILMWPNILRAPTSAFAVVLSLVPTATPFVMLPLATIPPGPPMWQQAAGVTLSVATTVLLVWAAGRVFRVGLLMQGRSASFRDMMRWVRVG